MTQQKVKLPKVSKRAQTEGSPRVQQLHFTKENQYLKERQEASSNKHRMTDLYARYQFQQKDPKINFKSQPPRQFSFQLQRQKIKSTSKATTSVIIPKEELPVQVDKEKSQIQAKQQNKAHQQFTFNSLVLSQAEYFYLLNLKGKQSDNHDMRQFCFILTTNNPFFSKINPAITEGLLRLGHITLFSQGELIYKQKLTNSIGFILWGKALLKNKTTGLRLGLPTGSSIGEQCLFDNQSPLNGDSYWGQRCRAVSSCGVLMLGSKELNWLCQQFISERMKEAIFRFRNILFRVYLRKKEFRTAK